MVLNIDFVIALVELLDRDFFDEEKFNRFIITKGARRFIEHENIMGRYVHIKDIKDELRNLMEYKNYEDKYDFYILRSNLDTLKRDIDYFRNNGEKIVKMSLNRVYRIIPENMKVKTDIYLYAGGPDGGFTVNRKDVYINILNYIGEREEFIKILSHELYHSRKVALRSKLQFNSQLISKKKRYAYGILGRIIEEGIACLIQHGPILFKDDRTGTLTRRNLSISQTHFDMLNNMLLDIKLGKFHRINLNSLNIYAIGYTIVTAIYNQNGTVLLDQWTVNLNFRDIIKEYIALCKNNKSLPEIDDDAIYWIIP